MQKPNRTLLIPWEKLLQYSVEMIISLYDIKKGSLAIDDSDNNRSKNTKNIWPVDNKLKDKASGGYIMGQGLVFMVLVTSVDNRTVEKEIA